MSFVRSMWLGSHRVTDVRLERGLRIERVFDSNVGSTPLSSAIMFRGKREINNNNNNQPTTTKECVMS